MAKPVKKAPKVHKDLVISNSSDTWGADSFKKYAKLAGAVEYDQEAAEQFADALNEIRILDMKRDQLQQLVDENRELGEFVWESQSGVIALHNIEDDHLGNIMVHLLRRGSPIPRAIRNMAINRGIVIPNGVEMGSVWDDVTTIMKQAKRIQADRSDI